MRYVLGAIIGGVVGAGIAILLGLPDSLAVCFWLGVFTGVGVAWTIGNASLTNSSFASPHSAVGIADTVHRIAIAAGETEPTHIVGRTLGQIRNFAEEGNAEAQTMLGLMYSRGDGVPQNHFEAMRWCRKAADQGHAEAQVLVAGMYNRGEGVPKSAIESANWFRKAAEQGHTMAQTLISMMYMAGHGVSQDHEQGFKWMHEAAKQGFSPAQHNVGGMYAEGQGVTQDYVEAYKWAILAAHAQTAEVKAQAIDYLTPKMTPSQIAEARRLAEDWKLI
jgi:TPR repeat protein